MNYLQSQLTNLTIKKISKAVLKKCEWGHDDYSLEIQKPPQGTAGAACLCVARRQRRAEGRHARKAPAEIRKGQPGPGLAVRFHGRRARG